MNEFIARNGPFFVGYMSEGTFSDVSAHFVEMSIRWTEPN